MAATVAALEDLLDALLQSGELRRILRRLGDDHARIEADLPDTPAAPRKVIHEAARLLVARGLADPIFFAELRRERSSRVADIDVVAALFAGATPTTPSLSVDRRALEAYIRAIQGRADLIAEALCGSGPLQLSRVYVEVQLDPQSAGVYDPSLHEIRTVEAALARGGAWALLGEAGSGKSSLLHHVTLELLEDVGADGLPRRLPVPLRAPRLQAGQKLSAAIAEEHGEEVVDSVLAFVEDGRAVLLIDGLDESGDVATAARAVNGLYAKVSDCPTLLASRPEGYSAPSAGFVRLKLCGLAETEQAELLGNLGVTAADAAGILARLRARPQLRRVAESPLLLTLAATLWREGRPQPERRSELFADAVRLLAEGRHRADETHWRHPDPDAAIEALTAVAGVLGGRGQVWGRDELLAQLERVARWQHPVQSRSVTAVEALEQLVRTGLLVPDDRHRPRAYQFPHRSLGEHLAARHLAARIRDEGVDGPTLGDVLAAASPKPEQWTEVLAQATGLLGGEAADGLVRRVIDMKATELMFRLIAEAEVLRPETFEEALNMQRGWNHWEARKVLLGSLPARIEDPAVVVGLIRRFVRGTTDGNDLYWAREHLRAIASGDFPSPVKKEVCADATAAASGIFDHLPKENLKKVQALLWKWWRNIPPAGERLGPYQIGSTEHCDEQPAHNVTLTEQFQMLGVPVTWEMYLLFDPTHAETLTEAQRRQATGAPQPLSPVHNVMWYAANMFASWVGARLPMEVEWELACRAGTTTRYWSGDQESDLAQVGWYVKNSRMCTHPTAQKPPNAWGLYDTHGNVWEWCLDKYDRDAYLSRRVGLTFDPVTASYCVCGEPLPIGASARTDLRVLRGGFWYGIADFARSAFRFFAHPSFADGLIGFRLARPLPPDEPSAP